MTNTPNALIRMQDAIAQLIDDAHLFHLLAPIDDSPDFSLGVMLDGMDETDKIGDLPPDIAMKLLDLIDALNS